MPADTDTPLPKTDNRLRRLKRFRPREALTIINSCAGGEKAAFARTWALARLLAWAILDQRPGKRQPKTQGSGAEKRPTHPLRTRNARLVGHLTLAHLLDRRLERESAKKDDETLRFLLKLFRLCGGFGIFVGSRGAKGLLSQAKKASRDLGYVYRITGYLCRYKKFLPDHNKFNLESAKYFLEADDAGEETYGISAISKIWEKYKQAAPYIFAFHRFFSPRLARTKSPDQVFDFIEKLASDQRRVSRLLGRAAYAADILSGKARDVRLADFKQITRVEPPLRPFDDLEKAIIDGIDRDAPIA